MSKLKIFTNTELPESEYHGDEYKDYLSGSELWEFLSKCPAEAVYGEKKETASLITGSAVHSEVLEMHSFDELYYRGYEPVEECLTSDKAIQQWLKAKGRAGFSNKAGEVLWEAVRQCDPNQHCLREQEKLYAEANEGKQFLPFSTYDDCKAMREQLMQYPAYAEAVNEGLCEYSIVGEIEIGGEKIKVKTRPDIIHNGTIVNYKTAASVKPDDLDNACYRHGYLMKEYFNALVFEALHGYFPEVLIIAQSKKKPYVCTGKRITEAWLDIGRVQFEKAFALWKACKDAGAYIDYTQGEYYESEPKQWMINETMS